MRMPRILRGICNNLDEDNAKHERNKFIGIACIFMRLRKIEEFRMCVICM